LVLQIEESAEDAQCCVVLVAYVARRREEGARLVASFSDNPEALEVFYAYDPDRRA
jgi:hypothetical protein